MRTIVIGDVHGCLYELQSLIATLDLRHDDRLIFVGDLVDKGPDSLGVLHYVENLLRLYSDSVVVAGNHEEKALRFAKRDKFEEPWAERASADDWKFIESMPLAFRDPSLDLTVVHGGIFPKLVQKHPDLFDRIRDAGPTWHRGGGKTMDRARRMLRTRYVSRETGEMLALGTNGPSDPFWADTYEGEFGTVLFGHDPNIDGATRWFPYAIGLDSGCVFGASLSAAVIRKPLSQEDPEIVTVVSSQRYAEPFQEE